METFEQIVLIVTIVAGALIGLLNVIAPLTKTEWDNKALTILRKFEELVLKILVPQFRDMMKDKQDNQLK